MLPILLLELFYKGLWLLLVAYPLWAKGTLAGSSVEYQAWVFASAAVVIAVMPWGYVADTYGYWPKAKRRPAALVTEVGSGASANDETVSQASLCHRDCLVAGCSKAACGLSGGGKYSFLLTVIE